MPSCFPLFQDLPCELRLEIWEAAIRPFDGRGGLHHFFIAHPPFPVDRSLKTLATLDHLNINGRPLLNCPTASVPESREANETCLGETGARSVYFWDAGMWAACKESRQVISKQCGLRRWNRMRRSLVEEYSNRQVGVRRMLHQTHWEEHQDMTAALTVAGDSKHGRLTVQPMQDLFRIVPCDWAEPYNWQDLFSVLPFSLDLGYAGVRHIAVQFDPTWHLDWPDNFVKLLREPSARGFLARTATARARMEMGGSIWLIDRQESHAEPAPGRPRPAPRIFYDLEDEFIETDPAAVMFNSDGTQRQNAASFLQRLAEQPWSGVGTSIFNMQERQRGVLPVDPCDFLGLLTRRAGG
ncbi:hypothetical protein ACJ41O_012067 [Fusarium nematophilum]